MDGSLQLDTHDDVNSFLLFHEEVDSHGGFEQHVSLPEFDVSGQGVSFGRLESSESSNIDHGLANGLAFGIRSLMFPGVGSEVFEEQVQGLDFFPGQHPDCGAVRFCPCESIEVEHPPGGDGVEGQAFAQVVRVIEAALFDAGTALEHLEIFFDDPASAIPFQCLDGLLGILERAGGQQHPVQGRRRVGRGMDFRG